MSRCNAHWSKRGVLRKPFCGIFAPIRGAAYGISFDRLGKSNAFGDLTFVTRRVQFTVVNASDPVSNAYCNPQ
jgi:hypothetical protein